MTQRFIEFVLMQAQNAAFMLGQIPHPQTGKAEVNLEMAQLLIDQLVMIQEKTRGNLNAEESRILAGAISNLQMSFVEADAGHSRIDQSPRRAPARSEASRQSVTASRSETAPQSETELQSENSQQTQFATSDSGKSQSRQEDSPAPRSEEPRVQP
ncbi:MAG: DUF1844 domain-containing protein, partial [Verrucomicrobia bacterium]|nr:DUF1844 domain-containing protein [Verrucomicrobiota bacterium]